MKIRTDFVTNSSSSSFFLSIGVELKNGESIGFSEICYDDNSLTDVHVTVSPKELGTAKNIKEMLSLLKTKVYGNAFSSKKEYFFDEDNVETKRILDGTLLAEASNENVKEYLTQKVEVYKKAQEFIEKLSEISSMDDIKAITISGDESNYLEYNRSFTYDLTKKIYIGYVDGDEFEKDGGSGGDLCFSDISSAYITDDQEEYEYYDEYDADVFDTTFTQIFNQLEDVVDQMYDARCTASFDESTKTTSITVEVVGTGYEGRSQRIEDIKEGMSLQCKRDPNNAYDSNNIMVCNMAGESLGNLSGELAGIISPILDASDINFSNVRAAYVEPLSKRSKRARKAILYVSFDLMPTKSE